MTLGSSRVLYAFLRVLPVQDLSSLLMREKRHVFHDLIRRQNHYFIAAHCTGEVEAM